MNSKSYMTISEFARITGIKRANLIFYDKIGLLSPEFRGENHYRLYTRQQLGSAYLITSLRELGLSLDEIRLYAKERTPERMLQLLEEQKKKIQKEMNQLRQTNDMMTLYADMAREGIAWDIHQIVLREQKKEPIFLGPKADPYKNVDESSIDFYLYAGEKNISQGYPLGCIVSKTALEEEWQNINSCFSENQAVFDNTQKRNPVDRYYFKVKQGQNHYKPQGLYAAACGYCGYGQSDFLYEKLFHYLKEHDLQICGEIYEEYLLNEMAIKQDDMYLTKVEIMVAYKRRSVTD